MASKLAATANRQSYSPARIRWRCSRTSLLIRWLVYPLCLIQVSAWLPLRAASCWLILDWLVATSYPNALTLALRAGSKPGPMVCIGLRRRQPSPLPPRRTGDSGASAVSTASDLVGFLWGTGGDTGWRGVSATSGSGGANDSGDQQVTLTTVAPTANVWTTLEVEVIRGLSDTGGHAIFYVDGVPKGKIDSPVNPSIALRPRM